MSQQPDSDAALDIRIKDNRANGFIETSTDLQIKAHLAERDGYSWLHSVGIVIALPPAARAVTRQPFESRNFKFQI